MIDRMPYLKEYLVRDRDAAKAEVERLRAEVAELRETLRAVRADLQAAREFIEGGLRDLAGIH